ncbi:unnamed protein product [Rotaria magnacalcarata]|uniref:Protein kinase domain-containing protein n=2 Tax=Rotaria magnacalcarata TaxID=392030 RepID=A0A816MM81_9BILA|nr:unnamed protein product [Rotaria magnacalcarata]CAF3870216.1 unnamed protein product [Rotaria magnacalcarata]
MFFIDQLNILLLLLCIDIISRCSVRTSPHGARKSVNEALSSSIRSLNLDSDTEDDVNQYGIARLTLSNRRFTDDEEEEEEDQRHSDVASSRISYNSHFYRRPNRFTLSESDSDDELSSLRDQKLRTSEIGSDSSFTDQSDSDRSRFLSDHSSDGDDHRTLVGFESPMGQKVPGYNTPTLGVLGDRSKIYSQRFQASSPQDRQASKQFIVADTPNYECVSFDEFLSPTSNGPLGSGQVASLNELYYSPIGGFNLDKNLWPEVDRRYIKIAKPPLAPGSHLVGTLSVTGFEIPKRFLQANEFGRQINNEALSNMKWKKTFISGNSATVFGIELYSKNFILKITKHNYMMEDDIPRCVHRNDIKSLHMSDNACSHKPKNGLIQKASCSADPNLVPLEYYIAEKIALANGFMPAAASISNTFAKDINEWYLIFDELPGVSPLKYGENILERLAKPLIRQQLEALKQIADCHIMHLDAHWGNILYSKEHGIRLIDFGLATIVDRFELPDHKATLIVTFTFDRCLDCRASPLGRDFEKSIKTNYPINGRTLLSHPWLQY